MKKALISLAWIFAASIFFGSFASAELFINDVFNIDGSASNDTYSRILNEYDSSWWYTSADTVVCDAANGWVSISSPIITDADLYDATTYRLFFSPYRVSQLRNSDVDISKIIMQEYAKRVGSTGFSFDISLADGLDNDQIYYAFLLPISEYDEIWTPSSEFCFKLNSNMCLWNEACDEISPQEIISEEEKYQEEQQITSDDNNTQETASIEENKSENNEKNQELNIPERTQEELQKVLDDWLTQEFHDAYDFWYHYWITTTSSAKEANMNSPLNRIAMAKMLSNYAINVLWKKPANIIVPKFPDVDSKLNEDYGWAVELAYQLGIMWIWIDKFRPFDPVTRKEFWTALSRMLFGLEDWTDVYYSTHLKKLKEMWIISNDNPDLEELRGYVMLMLMRSVTKK